MQVATRRRRRRMTIALRTRMIMVVTRRRVCDSNEVEDLDDGE